MSSFVTKTLDDAVNEIRMIINDNDVTAPRYTQDQVVAKINSALREVYRYRPDAWTGNFTLPILSKNQIPTFVSGDLGANPLTPWPLDDRLFFSPVVLYVAGILDLSDDEFADDNRAMSLLTSFRATLIGPGG